MISTHFFGFVLLLHVVFCGAQFKTSKQQHVIERLNAKQIQQLADLSDSRHIDYVLDEILIPRVVESPNHTKVMNFIKEQLRLYGLTVNVDEFQERTPTHGTLKFKNIIGTLNPNAERYLVLACHYDSKYFEKEEFVGATDSAVPCAMMLNLIKTMQQQLAAVKSNEVSLMLLFLDGEEAFREWSDSDSLYGARHLARSWDAKSQRALTGEQVSMLDRMDLFVLLDLLGARNPTFYSYFRQTDRHYLTLSRAEDTLAKTGMLRNHKRKYFKESASNSFVEDDHIPFLRRGVPILHLIPSPFPKEWHTAADNRNAIDMTTIDNLNKIMRVFVAEYLHVPITNSYSDDDDIEENTIHEEF